MGEEASVVQGEGPHTPEVPPAAPIDDPAPDPEPDPAPDPAPDPGDPDDTRSRRRRPGRRLTWAAVVLVLALVGSAVAAYHFDVWDRGRISAPGPTPGPDEPVQVPPPAGLKLPAAPQALPVARGLSPTSVDPAAVRRVLGRLPEAKKLGSRVSVTVASLDGKPAYRLGPGLVTPASTMKLLTTLAALESLGPEHRFRTRVVESGGRLTLVGGGDPLLARRPPEGGSYPAEADLTTLARSTAAALGRHRGRPVRLGYDDALFTGPAASPSWEPDYLSDDVVSPITSLWVDEGRQTPGLASRATDPARDAARFFADRLRANGVRIVGRPMRVRAGSGAKPLAEVRGAELVEVVQHVLEVSDNEGAEVLARQVALAEGNPASFTGASKAVRAVLTGLGVNLDGAVIHDGSGLSRHDRLRPRTLLSVLAAATDPSHPELGGVIEGLPVAGFSGSLADRFGSRAESGLGFVRAKTGTLTGVHGLAGVVFTRDRSVLLFVALADRVRVRNTLFARDQLDRIAAALARCPCRAAKGSVRRLGG